MIKFGIGNTLLNFAGKYYEYGGSNDINKLGLKIGGDKSIWLANLVASYLLGNSTKLFDKTIDILWYIYELIVFFGGDWPNNDKHVFTNLPNQSEQYLQI